MHEILLVTMLTIMVGVIRLACRKERRFKERLKSLDKTHEVLEELNRRLEKCARTSEWK